MCINAEKTFKPGSFSAGYVGSALRLQIGRRHQSGDW